MSKSVLLFIAKGAEELEISAFTDVFGWSRIHGITSVQLSTTGFHNPITCAWNLQIVPQLSFDQVKADDFDALAIPGGFEEAGYYDDAFDPRLLHLIREFHQKKKPIASICVGALALGKSGVLRQKNATTYDLPPSHRQKQLADFGARIHHTPIVVDANIITSTGPSTAIDVAFRLLEILTSTENANEVRKFMRFGGGARGD
jgi:4-methyl-5(b-hydroxyethyl)-thiazole monophosphate biosynthesis